MQATITYLLLTCGEPEVLDLIDYIRKYMHSKDRILVLLDNTKVTEDFYAKLKQKFVKIIEHTLEHSYAEHRNMALSYIKTDYCFALDSDEVPTELLINNIHVILSNFGYPDILAIMRRNIFKGVNAWDCLRYNWDLTDGNVVNWKRHDAQFRLFKTGKGIQWQGSVHEMINADRSKYRVCFTPDDPTICLIHNKTIERQRESNRVYNEKYSMEENERGGSTDTFKDER
jgi:hypothetical protein